MTRRIYFAEHKEGKDTIISFYKHTESVHCCLMILFQELCDSHHIFTEKNVILIDFVSDIITSYKSDFGKHAPTEDVPKIRYIWESLPSQLAKENKKFLYSVVKPGARAREYENALNWLRDADIVSKVNRISKPGLPLALYLLQQNAERFPGQRVYP